MAVDSGASGQILKSNRKEEPKSQEDARISSSLKRNKSPGIRLVGGRIYDSVNGKTCHQCRQKTRDFAAACTNGRNSKKPCPIMYCHKCLLNRYGEKAEEVAASGEWSCPKCKGICNCSVCMKKRGHQPTGILIKTAKATGFSSVSEMLIKGTQRLNCETFDALVAASPKKVDSEVIPSSRKRGKENSFDGKVDANLPNDTDQKPKRVKKGNKDDSLPTSGSPDKGELKHEALVDNKKLEVTGDKSNQMNSDRSDEMEYKKNDDKVLTEKSVNDGKKKPKKRKKDWLENNDTLARRTSPRKLAVSSTACNQEARLNVGVNDENINCRIKVTKKKFVKSLENDNIREDGTSTANSQVVLKQQDAASFPNISLPLGTELNSVAGIDAPTEDIGNTLQFLEFCAAFGKILEVRKGQAEHVLRDIFHGRSGRGGKFSVTVQFHIHLLSILQTEQGEEDPSVGKDSWFDALKRCLPKSQSLDCLERASGYESLEPSEKLHTLIFLCDEILGTEKVRSWIHEQNTDLAEKVKEAKQKVIAAKDTEKSLKQKMKDDIAKAIIAKHGAPLTILEHEAIVSHIKCKAAEAHAKVLESKGLLLKNSQTCNAVRIEPVLVGHSGNAYWKLNCCGDTNVLHQDVGKGDTLTLNEKWFTIDDEGKEAIEKHISLLRGEKLTL